MATTHTPNTGRASLLAGLRTGGVGGRSASAHIPHTAAPGGSFLIPRIVSQQPHQSYPEEDNDDDLADMPNYNNGNMYGAGLGVGHAPMGHRPMTAAVDGPNNRFSQQQLHAGNQKGMNPNSMPFSPAYGGNEMQNQAQAQAQAMQMQMMQLEIMRLQAIQNQQYQAELMAQAQRQQQQQQQQSLGRRASAGYVPPATAGPMNATFDLRSATVSAQMRRANAEQLKALGVDDQVPMTAALGGKFGSRTPSGSPARSYDDGDDYNPPPTPSQTTVISGGTSLGSPMSNNVRDANVVATNTSPPSKSDSVTSWRRGGNNNSVLSGNRSVTSSPSVRVTPPEKESTGITTTAPATPTPSLPAAPKSRPQPLRFSIAASQPMMPAVSIDDETTPATNDNDDVASTASSKSDGRPGEEVAHSSPTTPPSASPPLSPREEAAKKLYEGLGVGRPAPGVASSVPVQQQQAAPRMVSSQPMRQPRGPPGGSDEIGPKNFASRIRQKAIGGLGMLISARERREVVDAY